MTRLRVKRGDSIELIVGPVVDSAGTVQDLTGSTLRFTAKRSLADADVDAVVAGSTADGKITITNAAGGMARVNIPGAVTAALTADTVLVWDLQVSQPSGYVKTLDDGTLEIRRDITRAS